MEDLAAGCLTGGLTARIWERRSNRNMAQSAAEIALRDTTGASGRLLRRWKHGRATLSPGAITFEPFAPLGIRLRRPFTEPIELEVTATELDVRIVTGVEAWFVTGTVHHLVTPDGLIEMVVGHGTSHDWVMRRLGSGVDD